jgi:integrase
MPRKLPLYVERNYVKGHTYLSFRRGKGARIRLPDDPTSEAFREAYNAALTGQPAPARPGVTRAAPGTIAALIASYKRSPEYIGLRAISRKQYDHRLETLREDHGHRSVAGMTRKGIVVGILQPYADRPGAALDTLKKLRILIRHAIAIEWLKYDPSVGIKRPKGNEIRAWHDHELDAFEAHWPLGTKQRTAYAIHLYMGTARVDTHLITWPQVEKSYYERSKTGVAVQTAVAANLKEAIDAFPRTHVTVINTAYGKPFTVDGYSGFMRDAIKAAGLPMACQPHGLRKTLGRLLADAGATAHEIMAALGHTTLAEAERYTRDADRRRGGKAAIAKLDRLGIRVPQTAISSLGNHPKKEGQTKC